MNSRRNFDTVFIILDKMDKIGLDGVAEGTAGMRFRTGAMDKYLDLFRGLEETDDGLGFLADKAFPVSWMRIL